MDNAILRGLIYLKENINSFLVNEKLLNDKEEQLKSFVELVFFYNLLPEPLKEKEIFKFIDSFIINKVDTIPFIDLFEENVNALAGLATIEEYFVLKGKQYYSEYLNKIITQDQLDLHIYRVPFRQLDNKYSLKRAGIRDNLRSFEELYSKTVIGKKLSPFYYTENSMYSLTHTIFYLTEMGRLWNLSNIEKSHFLSIIKFLIVDRILENDLDILGELILCSIFLNLDSELSNLLKYAKEILLINQKDNGGFPAPKEWSYETNYAEFRNIYHTTIVCIGALIWCQEKNI
ncbi:hypothetical protein JEQ21_05840 [Streptococcus sp. 121]|uniref:DUF6895 family protein n=1 Tax=Streptococcus sp. 121 TaxID=2797637 RepID=UPI0018F07D6B|nr:hypothetical protein [Streptococcus sp. 121]MBJ6745977.1 hypothetical protein [Streptococcus sp. 121]